MRGRAWKRQKSSVRREGVTLVWHLLFLGSVTREAGGTKEKNQSPGDVRKGVLGGWWGGRGGQSAPLDPEKRSRVRSIKPVKLTCHYMKRSAPSGYIITLAIPFEMTEFLQLTRFPQHPICIINKSFTCHLFDFHSLCVSARK